VRQATLVAFYGPKRDPLGYLLRSWQARLAGSVRQLGAPLVFQPYPLPQIHATLLGLEKLPQPGLYNRNLHDFGGRLQAMPLPELFAFLLDSGQLPLEVQFGGFEDREYPFRSRGARPYHRSFSIQGTIAVAIGWPVQTAHDGRPSTREWPLTLEELRRGAQRFNVLHRWHRAPADADNDLYLRLGLLEGELAEPQHHLVEQEMRLAMSESSPSTVRINADDLAVVSYPVGEETLPVDRCAVVRLTDPRLRSEEFIAGLYA
jgi:hypothetical protein